MRKYETIEKIYKLNMFDKNKTHIWDTINQSIDNYIHMNMSR